MHAGSHTGTAINSGVPSAVSSVGKKLARHLSALHKEKEMMGKWRVGGGAERKKC